MHYKHGDVNMLEADEGIVGDSANYGNNIGNEDLNNKSHTNTDV